MTVLSSDSFPTQFPLSSSLLASKLTPVAEVLPPGLQLSVQGAGPAAEAGVVLVGAVPGRHDQRTVGEERVIGAARVHVDT